MVTKYYIIKSKDGETFDLNKYMENKKIYKGTQGVISPPKFPANQKNIFVSFLKFTIKKWNNLYDMCSLTFAHVYTHVWTCVLSQVNPKPLLFPFGSERARKTFVALESSQLAFD